MSNSIDPIVMPKWGLAMTEGMVNTWAVEEGVDVRSGDELCEIETSKLANMFESPLTGTLRRRVAQEGEILPVGALLAVVAEQSVAEHEVDAYIARFQESFVPEETDAGGPEPETVTVGGQKMVYQKVGDDESPPVLLLHGFGADMNGWMFNQTALAEHAPTYALDLPGHGKSIKDVGDGSIATLAGKVDDFIVQLGLEQVTLVGHSMGAGVALLVASDGRASVRSLVLIDPVGLGEEINGEFLHGFIEAKRQKTLRPVLEQLVADKSLISIDMMEDVFKMKRIDGAVDGLKALVESNFPNGRQAVSLRAKLDALNMPVTVIWGREDQIVPVSHAQGLADSVSVQIIDQSGHIPQMENSARVNEIIKGVLKT